VVHGCFGSRLLAEVVDRQMVILAMEWADREGFDRFLQSDEYRILLGMRILLEGEPRFTVDEVITRARIPTRESS
jgi:hypothetical protein